MTKQEKLEALKAFLKENGFIFKENFKSRRAKGVVNDLYVRRLHIAVHLSDEHDQEFYHATKRKCSPFFIREEESMEFIIEKMQNTIIKLMKRFQKSHQRRIAREARENGK